MLRHTLKFSLLALGLAATAPLSAQQRAPRAPRPNREWVAARPGRHAAGGHRRHNRQKHRAHRAQRSRANARVQAYRRWRTI